MAEKLNEVRVAAALLGRRGGLASGPARMEKMSFKDRQRVAKNAIATRWRKRDEARQAEAAAGAADPGQDAPRGNRRRRPGGGPLRNDPSQRPGRSGPKGKGTRT